MSGSSGRLRAVVDTNLFVSAAIGRAGPPRQLLDAWIDQRYVLLLSDAHFMELADVLTRPRLVRSFRFGATEMVRLFDRFAAAERVTPSPNLVVEVRDPKDVKLLAAALGGGADYLVTGDADLLALRDHPGLGALRIVTAAEFLAVLDAADG